MKRNKLLKVPAERSRAGKIFAGMVLCLWALSGCDTAAGNDDENYLASKSNPFIGTWEYSSTNMMNVTTVYQKEFKTDGTIAVTTKQGENEPVSSTEYYLVKDKFLVVSTTSGLFYIKYLFEVIDNNHIKLIQDTGGTATYTRDGAENPNAGRTFALSNGIDGFWRRDNLNFGTEEAANFMYDWYTFNKNGTYHVYHYMNKNKHYIDRGEYAYFIDGGHRLISLSRGYTVTVYHDITPSGENAFSWKTAPDSGALGFEKFDGETFWHAAE